MTEQAIQKKIVDYLSKNGAYSVKTIATNSGGTPDILCCFKGRFCAIEVKSPKGKVSELQKWHIEQIKKAGGVAFVARSIDEVQIALREAGLIEER